MGRRLVRPDGQVDGHRRRGGRQLWLVRGLRQRHRRGRGPQRQRRLHRQSPLQLGLGLRLLTERCWPRVHQADGPDAAADDYFGVSVAIDGETIVVGAYAKNFGTGAAYVYRTSDDGATHDHVAKLTSPGAMGDAFGISVAVDVAAVVVGAGQWLNLGSGSAYIYEEIPQKTASSSQSAYNLTSDAARSLPAAATLLAAGAALAL